MPAPPHPATEVASNLALAVIVSSHAPLLLLDDDLAVVAVSASFCAMFQIDPASVPGRAFGELGGGEWNVPQLRSLLKATAAGSADIGAYEMDLVRKDRENRRLVLHAHRLDYGDPENVRIMLAVLDVTDARLLEKLKDDTVREKAVLFQELQHRVANSLQIIASVLMQSARKVQSEETRLHLRAAHSRVMSVASVQRQLAVSSSRDVALRPYFAELCQSLGASMIRDPAVLSLEVKTDESVTSGEVSVSLGLIVTELVINALKHAFPESRAGTISVDYRSSGSDWTLSVNDDGVGMEASAQRGLGSSIVEALAAQLKADIHITDNRPGTAISIAHIHAIGAAAEPARPAI